MTRFPELLTTTSFASGVLFYSDIYGDNIQSNSIVVPVTLGGQISLNTILDTGSTWCIFNPSIVKSLNTGIEELGIRERISIRGIFFEGALVRIDLQLHAEQGIDLKLAATAFVPTLLPEQPWTFPNFLGLDGLLLRMRFALDPGENAFYFAAV